MTVTTLRHRKTGMYGVGKPVPYFYAFHDLGSGQWAATIYSDVGNPISVRDVDTPGILGFPDSYLCACALADPAAVVADGALVGLTAEDTIAVWDVTNAITYTYTAAGGKYVTWPIILSGKLYWWEWAPTNAGPADTLTFTLRRASFDLTDAATVGSVAHPDTFPAGSTTYPLTTNALSTDAAVAYFHSRMMRVAVAGGAGSSAAVTANNCTSQQPDHAIPDSTGKAIGARCPAASPLVRSMETTVAEPSANSATRWPTSWGMLDPRLSFSTSADRTRALLFSSHLLPDLSGNGAWATEAPSTATSGDPVKSLQIHDHPDHSTPGALFLMS